MAAMTLQGNGAGDGMTTIEKAQLLLICSFLCILFIIARRHLTLRTSASHRSDIQSLSLVTEVDGRSGAADVL